MLFNNQLSVVAISDIKTKKTMSALLNSSIALKPSETILFSSKAPVLDEKQSRIIKFIKVKPIKSIKDYSNFIIYNLYKYIKTSHILIVQWDGYVCNLDKWDQSFLKYDYIGAPFIPRGYDYYYSRDKNGAFYTIGNGGFSLRSKALLEAPSKFGLKDDFKFTNFHEDGFFCVLHRKFLETKGFNWAPYKIAKNFAIESPLSFNDIKNLPLGFHGKKMHLLVKSIRKLKKIIKFLKLTFLTEL